MVYADWIGFETVHEPEALETTPFNNEAIGTKKTLPFLGNNPLEGNSHNDINTL